MKLPRTRNRWTERLLIDDAFDANLEWRGESAEVWHADKRWNGAPAREARRKFWAYRAALEREEHAARIYGRLASRLEARGCERAEKRRLSHLRPPRASSPPAPRRSRDGLGMREAAASEETRRAGALIAGLKVTESVCPYLSRPSREDADVMPQQDDGIPVAEHPLERSAS